MARFRMLEKGKTIHVSALRVKRKKLHSKLTLATVEADRNCTCLIPNKKETLEKKTCGFTIQVLGYIDMDLRVHPCRRANVLLI